MSELPVDRRASVAHLLSKACCHPLLRSGAGWDDAYQVVGRHACAQASFFWRVDLVQVCRLACLGELVGQHRQSSRY